MTVTEKAEADRASNRCAAVLGLTLPGDTVLYLLLPLYASSFGVTLAEAGLLLAANRLVRIAGYGWVARSYERHGPRAACVAAAAAAAIATGGYAVLPGVWDYIAAGYLTSGSRRNPAHYGIHVTYAPEVTPAQRTLLWEVETSGGLLLAVPADRVDVFTAACAERGQACWRIGEVVEREGIDVVV